jgi:hypothetical protein
VSFELLVILVVNAALTVGIVLLFRGLRGVPVLSLPTCARCGYDLRGHDPETQPRCPECGNDLSASWAVRFGERRRRPRLLLAGTVLVLVPFLAVGATFLRVLRHQPGRSAKSTDTLVAELATTADEPWTWNELERRANAGGVDDEQAAAAIDHLIHYLRTRPGGPNQPLHWAGNFVKMAVDARAISDKKLQELAEAYFGPEPAVELAPAVRAARPIAFKIDYGHAWDLAGLQVVESLREVRVKDGEPLAVQPAHNRHADYLTGKYYEDVVGVVESGLPPGRYELVFTVDLGLVDRGADFSTATGRPGPPNRWPNPRLRWSKDVIVPLAVVPADQSPIELVTDESLNPAASGHIRVELLQLRHSDPRYELYGRLAYKRDPPVPVACRIRVLYDGHDLVVASVAPSPDHDGSVSSSVKLPGRPSPEAITADVILEPDPDYAEQQPGLSRIWGKPIVFRDVPVERDDLGGDAPTQ